MTLKAPTRGYVAATRIAGIEVLFHWTFPIFGLVISGFLGDWSLRNVLASIFAYVLLVLAHEFGHAFFAWRSGMKVHALVITGGGGYCYSDLPTRSLDRLLLYSGGLLCQLVLFLLSLAYILAFGVGHSPVLSCFLIVFTVFNALIFIGNIVPYRQNDGSRILQTIREIRRNP